MFKPKNFKLAEVHAMVSCLKALFTWNGDRALQESRECCGGFGFSHYARIGVLKQDFDVNQTWEGDNNILLQQTGKFLLELYRMKLMGKQKKQTLTCEWLSIDSAEENRCPAKEKKDFLDMEMLKTMLEHRCNMLLQKTAQVLASKMTPEEGKKIDTVEEWNNSQVFYVHNLAKAYSELLNAFCFLLKFKETKHSV